MKTMTEEMCIRSEKKFGKINLKPRIDVAAPLLLLAQNVLLEKTEEYLLNEQFDHSFIQLIHNLINTYEKNLGNNI